MKAETKFKVKVLRDLRQVPCAWFSKIQQVGIRGTPDILGCVNGHFIALELKASRASKVDALQFFTLEAINKAGGYARIMHPDNFREILEGIYEYNKEK